MTRLAYLGPPGTWGELAAMKFDPDAELLPFPSHAAVAVAVESGMADAGVVAIVSGTARPEHQVGDQPIAQLAGTAAHKR